MKISFLCGSFEPGKDGVGDYTRQFVHALVRRGHVCQVIALADRFVTAPVAAIDALGVEVVRIPEAEWSAGRTIAAEIALQRFAPDCVSLQMVCYAFERHGLLLRSARAFERLRGHRKSHVMLHELWIGESSNEGGKARLLGRLQRLLLLRVLKRWGPDVIHTSNPVYRELLGRSGIPAAELPLPGTVATLPTNPAAARGWLLQRLATADPHGDAFLAGVFGSIHPEWNATGWLLQLHDCCRAAGRRLVLVQIGRAGEQGRRVWGKLQADCAAQIGFAELGTLSAEDTSWALQGLDLGVATSPWALAGKSASAATMLDHGVPVVFTRADFSLRRGSTPEPRAHPLLRRFDSAFLRDLRHGTVKRTAPQPRQDAYELFMDSLA